jgi:hypothetical protein
LLDFFHSGLTLDALPPLRLQIYTCITRLSTIELHKSASLLRVEWLTARRNALDLSEAQLGRAAIVNPAQWLATLGTGQ